MFAYGTMKVNGHSISIQTYHEQGGGVEDFVAWCHTCDPKGNDTMTVDVRTWMTPARAWTEMMTQVAEHPFREV